jgi:hypothetical protein
MIGCASEQVVCAGRSGGRVILVDRAKTSVGAGEVAGIDWR